jgi:hypothetical protein
MKYKYDDIEILKEQWKLSIMWHQLAICSLMAVIVYLVGVILTK